MNEHKISQKSGYCEEYEEVRSLGWGAQGEVNLVRRKSDLMLLARKTIRSRYAIDGEQEILQKLRHHHIVKFIDYTFEAQQERIDIYTEYCEASDLVHFFSGQKHAVTENVLWQILFQIAAALAYCHHGLGVDMANGHFAVEDQWEGIIHRDIKPGNVLVSSWKDEKISVKLCDFGISREYITSTETGTDVGTKRFREPESQIVGWTFKSDIYSLGHTIQALAELNENLVTSKEFQDTVARCKERNRSQRICAVSLLNSVPKGFRAFPGCFRIKTPNSASVEASVMFASQVLALVANVEIEGKRLKRLVGDFEADVWRTDLRAVALEFAVENGLSSAVTRLPELDNAAVITIPEGEAAVDIKEVNERNLLHLAVVEGNLTRVFELVNLGADVNHQDSDGRTPLHLAALNGDLKVVEKLLDHGAAVDIKNYYTRTPLYLAAVGRHLAVAQKLLDHGATVNAEDDGGRTLLHSVVLNGDLESVKMLLDHEAAVNVQDDYEQTPLHLAAENGLLDVVQKLLDHGAAIDVRDIIERTPLDMATENGHLRVAELLVQA